MPSRIEDAPDIKSDTTNLSSPASLGRTVSPPPFNPRRLSTRQSSIQGDTVGLSNSTVKSTSAKIEAGEIDIDDHVSFFSSKLRAATHSPVPNQPRLSHSDWLNLYHRNLTNRGHHFVVHQHDHPIAGTHYDLRIQCNTTSSISFALPYGLPGDPNGRKLNRFAIETRVHNLWNHLIETASHETGTMLLWDTGEYEVLPYDPKQSTRSGNDTADTESEDDNVDWKAESEPQKLHREFQKRKIKLRLNGTRLPKGYTISIRLMEENNSLAQPNAPAFKRGRKNIQQAIPSTPKRQRRPQREDIDTSSDSSRSTTPQNQHAERSESQFAAHLRNLSSREPSPSGTSFETTDQSPKRKPSPKLKRSVSSLLRTASPPPPRRSNSTTLISQPPTTGQPSTPQGKPIQASPPVESKHLDDSTTETPEDVTIRELNAYPGATNSINSIHQRRWFLSLDRQACGFRPTKEIAFGRRIWERPVLTSPRREARDDRDEKDNSDIGKRLGGFPPFYVRGRDFETSILTGRLAGMVALDEGLVGYKPRGGWKGITD